MSVVYYVADRIHDSERLPPYLVDMRDIGDGPGSELATLIKGARTERGMTQEALETASGVSRQTIIRYESGKATAPRGSEVRAVCRALGIDPRRAAVALGIVTADELSLPPERRQLDPLLEEIQRLLDDEKIPPRMRANLLRGVQAARDVWLEMVKIRAPKEPSAAERAGRRSPSPR